jgi:hypothetical protein
MRHLESVMEQTIGYGYTLDKTKDWGTFWRDGSIPGTPQNGTKNVLENAPHYATKKKANVCRRLEKLTADCGVNDEVIF